MRPRVLFAFLIPFACALVFIRLGVWQLSRHQERAAVNIARADRLSAPPAPVDSLRGSPQSLEWRRVSVSGKFDYALEQVQSGRVNAGSPGVHLITPLRREGRDTVITVVRGWVYSANASAADLGRWREEENVTISGYVLPLADTATFASDPARPLRVLDRETLAQRFGAPVAPMLLVMTSDSVPRLDSVPRRLVLPAVDRGPHLSYAFQWFAFATIAIVGGALLARRTSALT